MSTIEKVAKESDLDDYSHPFPEEDEELLNFNHITAYRKSKPLIQLSEEEIELRDLKQAAYRLVNSCPGDYYIPPNDIIRRFCIRFYQNEHIPPHIQKQLISIIRYRMKITAFVDSAVDRYQLDRPQWRKLLDYDSQMFVEHEQSGRTAKWLDLALESISIGMQFREGSGQGAGFARRVNEYLLACLWKTPLAWGDLYIIMEMIKEDYDAAGISESEESFDYNCFREWERAEKGWESELETEDDMDTDDEEDSESDHSSLMSFSP